MERTLFFVFSFMRAYTLFEVLIVLGLLSIVLLFINMAIDIHVRQMTINRTEVEEAQLARVLLEKIAGDIRNVVITLREETLEVDTAALSTVMGISSPADMLSSLGSGTSTETGTQTASESTVETSTSTAAADSTTAGESSEEETMIYGTIPGIYGDLEWIQIDTGKLPRGEMYGSRQIRRGTSAASDRLSSSKTVLYYLGQDTGQLAMDDPRYQPEQLIGSLGRLQNPQAAQYGLYRRQLDRQAAQYAIQEGLETEYEQYDEPLAPEVEWIEFAYFDPELAQTGTTGDWAEVWDMDDRQMLPLAVRITAAIRRPALGRGLFSLGSADTMPEPVIYSLIVPIPVSVEVPAEEEETTTEETSAAE